MPLTDLSGRALPSDTLKAVSPRVLAIPPVRDVPNSRSVEFLETACLNVPANTFGGAPLLNGRPVSSGAWIFTVPDWARGRIDWIRVESPNLSYTPTNNHMFWYLLTGSPGAASGTALQPPGLVQMYGTAGVYLSQLFNFEIDLYPNQILSAGAANTDTLASHFIDLYIHGWLWPRDMPEGVA